MSVTVNGQPVNTGASHPTPANDNRPIEQADVKDAIDCMNSGRLDCDDAFDQGLANLELPTRRPEGADTIAARGAFGALAPRSRG